MRAREFITESITDTPQFKRWFRNSVVVDSNGRPMVVYHGSRDAQNIADRGFSAGEAHFGTAHHALARSRPHGRVRDGAGTFPVYLSIQNPKRVEDQGKWSADYLNKIKSEGYDGVVYLNRWEGIDGKENSFDDDMYTDEEFLQAHPEARDSYIVFYPNQIKSATGNNGKFDPKNPDITKESSGFISEETTTLQQLYKGEYPDRYEDFWDHVRQGEFDIPLNVKQMSPMMLATMLRSQYRVEHLGEITNKKDGLLSDQQRTRVAQYMKNRNLSNSVILVCDGRIIDGNHRALAAALKQVPIKYVDLADLEGSDNSDDTLNEIRFEKSQQGFMDMTHDMDREYKYAGSGYYSRVYQHPTQDKTLIKVFKNDRGYAEWLRFMAGHQNNRYVPQIIPHEDGSIIKAYKFFKALPGNQATTQRIGIVNLRKLEIATVDQIEDFITFVMNYLDEDTANGILSGRPPERRKINWFDKFGDNDWSEVARNSAKKDPDLSAVATELDRMIKRHGYLDIHNENLMWDSQRNNIVFIDVLSVG